MRAVAALGRPSILKTRRFGYDGKGQALIREGSNLSALHRGLGGAPTILEGFVEFRAGSVGDRRARPRGRFRGLRSSAKTSTSGIFWRAPAFPPPIAPATAAAAVAIARQILEALDYVGVLAVEMFVTREADGLEGLVDQRIRAAGP